MSSYIIDSVTVQWLVERLGPTRRWSSDALAAMLDGPLLSRVSSLWPRLPTAAGLAVVKQRLLLALLTARTPLAEDTLAGARALVAVALRDAGPDAEVSEHSRTRKGMPSHTRAASTQNTWRAQARTQAFSAAAEPPH